MKENIYIMAFFIGTMIGAGFKVIDWFAPKTYYVCISDNGKYNCSKQSFEETE